MNQILKRYWPVFPALTIFFALAWHFNFTQDDAYISYRFVANYLNGDGLVYNLGERVEGFTNFGWVVYLIFWGALTGGFILASKITGLLFGAGIIVLTFLIGKLCFDDNIKYAGLAALLVGLNQSLAYWAPAGLETAAFGFMVMLAFYLFLKRSHWLVFPIVLAVWLRPEGAFLAGLLILLETIQEKRFPRYSFSMVSIAFVLSLPYVAFKLFYYGSILPNPFYAKTGLNAGIVSSGLEYVGRFFKHYGFYGTGFLLSIFGLKKMNKQARTVLLFSIFYLAYIVIVGGDVLKVHRFFIPIFGLCSIVMVAALFVWIRSIKEQVRPATFMILAVALLAVTYVAPKEYVDYFNYYEKKFLHKMGTMARNIDKYDDRQFSVALPTIGIFGYELIGHRIIDMVGLTDTTIARHSEEPIDGMETTWKEKKHNSKYLLESAPDYIMFSTGNKPSAPAERALLLYPQFHQSYRTVGWLYSSDTTKNKGVTSNVFKKVRPITGEIKATYPVSFVEYFKKGMDAYSQTDFKRARSQFLQAMKASPQPYYPDLLYQTGYCYMQLQEHDKAIKIFNQILSRDSLVYMAHQNLYLYARLDGDTAAAALHRRWVEELVPWNWERLNMITEKTVEATNRLNNRGTKK